jgi:hypothetical protein
MKQKSLLEHTILKLYLGDLNSITKILLESRKSNKKPEFTKKQILIYELFNFLIEIENKQKDIQIAKLFLKSPNTIGKINKKIQIRSDYIKYHIEFYQISIVGIFDRILHLINFIYKLGLSDRHVKQDIICSNTNIPKNILSLIKEFDKNIEPIRKNQNSVKHKTKINLPELYNAELLDFTLHQWQEIKTKKIKVNFSWSKEDEVSLKKDADFYYQIFLKQEQEKIEQISSSLDIFVGRFLDILEVEFKKQM